MYTHIASAFRFHELDNRSSFTASECYTYDRYVAKRAFFSLHYGGLLLKRVPESEGNKREKMFVSVMDHTRARVSWCVNRFLLT